VNTLHGRIKKAVKQRLAVAQAATPGPWFAATDYPQMVATERLTERRDVSEMPDDEVWLISTTLSHRPAEDAQFVAANDPARIIRDCTEDLAVLDEHAADDEGFCYARTHMGLGCLYLVCPEVLSLARRYDIPQEDS